MSPRKEPRFFSFEGAPPDYSGPGDHRENSSTITSFEEYKRLFESATSETAIGEASPPYMYIPGTAKRIAARIPDAKIVAILRNPAERAFSNFLDKRLSGDEPCHEFSRALHQEPKRIANNWSYSWHYSARGYYYRQLLPFFAAFPRENIRVWLYDDLNSDAAAMVKEVYEFLEVDPAFEPNVDVKYRVSGTPRSEHLMRAMRGTGRLKRVLKKALPARMRMVAKARIQAGNLIPLRILPEDRALLMNAYQEDINMLGELLDRDLSHWSTQAAAGAERDDEI